MKLEHERRQQGAHRWEERQINATFGNWTGMSLWSSLRLSDPVFKAVGVPALFAAQVYEEMRGPGSVLRCHIPHDAEGVAGHLTDLDITGGGKRGLHVCHLSSNQEIKRVVIWEHNYSA